MEQNEDKYAWFISIYEPTLPWAEPARLPYGT